jgi:hypothetical protein
VATAGGQKKIAGYREKKVLAKERWVTILDWLSMGGLKRDGRLARDMAMTNYRKGG